jgi:hypothetical protein
MENSTALKVGTETEIFADAEFIFEEKPLIDMGGVSKKVRYSLGNDHLQ